MKQTSMLLAATAAAMTFIPFAGAQASPDVTGVWINDTGRGAVEIKPCGKALCGHVVWVKDTNDAKGCGKQIIGDAQSSGGGVWDGGWIYSPEKRKNYDVELKPLSDGTLRVVGYMGTKLFSRTMIWTRAPADLQRCGTIEAKADLAPVVVSQPAKEVAPAPASEPAKSSAATASDPTSAPASAAPAASAPAAVAKTEPVKPDVKSDAKPEAKPETASKDAPAATDPAPAKSAEASAEGDDDLGGEKPGERKSGGGLNLKNLKLGDLELDKVLTKTKSGKCKLDLPWVKVLIDCEQ
jgi:uncharacterized protein (DUF2147 family)